MDIICICLAVVYMLHIDIEFIEFKPQIYVLYRESWLPERDKQKRQKKNYENYDATNDKL